MTSVLQWQRDYQARVRARRSRLVGRVRYGLKPPRRDRTAMRLSWANQWQVTAHFTADGALEGVTGD